MSRSKRPARGSGADQNLGIFDPNAGMADIEKQMYGNLNENADLEAELAALMGGGGGSSDEMSPQRLARPQAAAPLDISRMAASGTMDIDDNADEENFDENDPDLLAELAACMEGDTNEPPVHTSPQKASAPPAPASVPRVTTSQNQNSGVMVQILSERLKNYQAAVTAAKVAGETSKVRRYERSVGTLQDLMKRAERGGVVVEDDIPPEVAIKAAPRPSGQERMMNVVNPTPAPPPPAPSSGGGKVNTHTLKGLTDRQAEFKAAALQAKNAGNIEEAKEFLTVSKQFDGAIEAVKSGEDFDLADMPPAPVPSGKPSVVATPAAPPPAAAKSPAKASGSSGNNLLSALTDRLNLFKGIQQKSEQEGNSSKARRYGRIVSQYTEAVTACRSKKPYNYGELPDPPGADPLPLQQAATPTAVSSAAVAVVRPGGPPPKLARSLSRSSNQQMVFLADRQNKFKAAALDAKRRGQIDLAKQLLRQSKSFDQVIRAAEGGLPVDLSKMPSLPGENNIDFEFLEAEECEMPNDLQGEDRDTTYTRLQRNLLSQIKTARENHARFLKIGDVMTADKFEKLAKTCQLDLQALDNANKHKDPVPRFHYEWKTFSVMQANPDLAENDLEFTVVQGIDLRVPSGFRDDQLDTYVKVEFPLPSDSPQTHQTDTVKSTNSPEYNSTAKFQASRKSRAFLRLIQSKGVKLEIMYRRGILKKDGVLGTVTAKLPQLEQQCTVHDSFDMMEGRRAIGGKLELRVRIREPIAGKQVEQMREKWLVIDDYDRPSRATAGKSAPRSGSAGAIDSSIEVLMYERTLIQQKMQQLKAKLTPSMEQALMARVRESEEKIRSLEVIRQKEVNRYLTAIGQLVPRYTQEAQAFLKQGDREKAQVQMTKKKLVEKEVTQLKAKHNIK